MIKQRADELVAALRSGKYKQGTGKLRNPTDNSFCCLGVACDISGLSNWVADNVNDDDKPRFYLGAQTQLPPSVKDYFDFHSNEGAYSDSVSADDYRSLIAMNDSGVPFAKIADFIEKHWEAL